MTPILNSIVLQVALIVIYFESFVNADEKCLICEFSQLARKHLTANDTFHPRGCFSESADKLAVQNSATATTCSWDIVAESFETYQVLPMQKNKKTQKKWRLAQTGIVSTLNFGKKTPGACEKLQVPYTNLEKGKRPTVFRCNCETNMCNKHYPLCKWLRAADPSLKDPIGCVEDDTFPSEKEPNLFKGLIYNRLDGEEVPQSEINEEASGSRTCADEISDIYDDIKEIQNLLKDEL